MLVQQQLGVVGDEMRVVCAVGLPVRFVVAVTVPVPVETFRRPVVKVALRVLPDPEHCVKPEQQPQGTK